MFVMPPHQAVVAGYVRHFCQQRVSGGVGAFVKEQHELCGGARQFTAVAPSLLAAYGTSECTTVLHCLAWLHHPYKTLGLPKALFESFLLLASSQPDVPFDTIVSERVEAVAPLAVYIAKRKGLNVPDLLPAYQLGHYDSLYGGGSGGGAGPILEGATFKYKASRIAGRFDETLGGIVFDVQPSRDDPRGRELTQRLFARFVRDEDLARLEVEMSDLISEFVANPVLVDVNQSIAVCSLDVDQGVSSRVLFENAKTMLFLLHAVCVLGADMEDFVTNGITVMKRETRTGEDGVAVEVDVVDKTVYSVVVSEFKDEWKRRVPGDLTCLGQKEAPATLRMFNMIWAWVLCMVRSEQPTRPGGGMDKVFVQWLRRMAGAVLPVGSPALALLDPEAGVDVFDFEAACSSVDRLTGLLYQSTPYTGHDDVAFRELVSAYYLRFAEASPTYPVVNSTDPYFVTPSALQLFPVGATDAEDDIRYTRACVQYMEEVVRQLSEAKSSPPELTGDAMAPASSEDCVTCANRIGQFMAFHVFETVRSFVSGSPASVVMVRHKDKVPPLLNFTKSCGDEVYLSNAVILCLEPSWGKTLGDLLQWYCFFCMDLQRRTKKASNREAVEQVLHNLVSSFCGELARLTGALPALWPNVKLVQEAVHGVEPEPVFMPVANYLVFGAIAHSALAGVIGYDASRDRSALQNLFGAMAAPSPVSSAAIGAPPAFVSNVGFAHHGLAVDKSSAESCNVSMDYESPLFQVMVWWPAGGRIGEDVGDGIPELTAEAVRGFVTREVDRQMRLGSVGSTGGSGRAGSDGAGTTNVFKEGNAPVVPLIDLSSASDVSELTQRCKLGRVVVDCEQLLEVRTFPGFLDVRVKPGVAITLQEVVERNCYEFRAVGDRIVRSVSEDSFGFDSTAANCSSITFPSHDVAWKHVNQMATDPVLIGPGFVLRRQDDMWKPWFYTAPDFGSASFLDVLRLRRLIPVDIVPEVMSLFELLAYALFAYFQVCDGSVPGAAIDVAIDDRKLDDALDWYQEAFVEGRGNTIEIRDCVESLSLWTAHVVRHIRFSDAGLISEQLYGLVSGGDAVVSDRASLSILAPFLRPQENGISTLASRLLPVVNTVVQRQCICLLSLINKTGDVFKWQYTHLPWTLRKVLYIPFVVASRKHVWSMAAFASKSLGVTKVASSLFPLPVSTLTHSPGMPLFGGNRSRDPWVNANKQFHVKRMPTTFFPDSDLDDCSPSSPELLSPEQFWLIARSIQEDRIDDRLDSLHESSQHLQLPVDGVFTSYQVQPMIGPDCRRLRFLSSCMDGGIFQYHPSEGLPICYIVHDCLWQCLLPAGDSKVYLVRDADADLRLSAFIAHTLRSPLHWYFKCLVLEALCGESVGPSNRLRRCPTSNEVVIMFALVDRFTTVVKSVSLMCVCVQESVRARDGKLCGWF
jgi:hypothetical protein